MASSIPTNAGQALIQCRLCHTETNVTWKCLNCEICMCTRCKVNNHVRDHTVVDIKITHASITCQQHGQICCMFCKLCDKLACPTCISKTHNGHQLVQVQEGYKINVEKLKEGQRHVETKINKLIEEERRIQEIRKVENRKYFEAKEGIENQNKAMKAVIDQHTDKLMRELNGKWEKLRKGTEREMNKILDIKKTLQNQKSRLDSIIQSKDSSKIFQEVSILVKSMNEDIQQRQVKFESIQKFLPGQITEHNVGSLQEIGKHISLKLLKEFTTDISKVLVLSPSDDGSLWISDLSTTQKVKPEGNNLKVLRSIHEEIMDMGGTSINDDLLLAKYKSTLEQINGKTGELIGPKYGVDPLVATCIYVSRGEKVLVGARNPSQPYHGRAAIIRMDHDGGHERMYETDNNQQIFTLVRCITEISTGTIFAVDRFCSNSKGRVVVLGQEGGIQNTYCGPPGEKHFKPVRVLSTLSDFVIVTILNNNILHILNYVGDLISYYDTKFICVDFPFSLGFTKTGTCYIGCTNVTGCRKKAKLYEVTLKGI